MARQPEPPMSVYEPAGEDRTLPIAVYVLYLVGLTNLITAVVGLIIAYAFRDQAGAAMRSHYAFQIRTFWIAVVFWLIGALLCLIGLPLTLVLIGFPLLWIGGLIIALTHLWVALRCVMGLVHVWRYQPYPRPTALLI
jgi:uncharacterized membrane protein